jgi:hypothetical protein
MKTNWMSPLLAASMTFVSVASAAAQPCLSRVASYEAFRSAPDTAWSLALDDGPGALHYFGAEHTSDPASPMFDSIAGAWKAARPTIAFYEGPNRGIAADQTATIAQFGESGYVRFLAEGAKIPAKSLEPSPVEEMRAMVAQFTPDEVALFYVLREAARLRDRKSMQGDALRGAVGELIAKASKIPGLDFPVKSVDDLDALYKRHFDAPAEWAAVPAAWFDPLQSSATTGGKFTNDINRASSSFRNRHMSTLLADAVNQGERVFAVVGRNHVPLQAEAIRCLVAEK